jgi:hypothetical protein
MTTPLRVNPSVQPVPDLSAHSTATEHRYDRDLAREDRIHDYADADTCAAIETYLRAQAAVSVPSPAKPDRYQPRLLTSEAPAVGPASQRVLVDTTTPKGKAA